jgi:hypothetical protein
MSRLTSKLENLQNISRDLVENSKNSLEILDQEYKEFLADKEKFEKENGIENFHVKENIVEINVGGVVFTTMKSTLAKAQGTLLG